MPKGHFEINNRKNFLLMQMNRIFEAPLNRVEKSRVEVSNILRHTYLKPLLVRPVSSSWPCSVYHKRPCNRKSLPLTHSQPESHRLYKWEGRTYKKHRLNNLRKNQRSFRFSFMKFKPRILKFLPALDPAHHRTLVNLDLLHFF